MSVVRTMRTLNAIDLQDRNRVTVSARAPGANLLSKRHEEIQPGDYDERIAELQSQLERLRITVAQLEQAVERFNDLKTLAISTSIREPSDSMLDALHPIRGRLVARTTAGVRDRLVRPVMGLVHKVSQLKPIAPPVQDSSMDDALADWVLDERPSISGTKIVTELRRYSAAPFYRRDTEFRLAPLTRIFMVMVIVVFLLAIWRLWHASFATPFEGAAIAGQFLLFYRESRAPRARFEYSRLRARQTNRKLAGEKAKPGRSPVCCSWVACKDGCARGETNQSWSSV